MQREKQYCLAQCKYPWSTINTGDHVVLFKFDNFSLRCSAITHDGIVEDVYTGWFTAVNCQYTTCNQSKSNLRPQAK